MNPSPVRAMPASASLHRTGRCGVGRPGGPSAATLPAAAGLSDRSERGWSTARSTSARYVGVGDLGAVGVAEVERVEHVWRPCVCTLADADVEVELGDGPGDAVQHPDASGARTSITVAARDSSLSKITRGGSALGRGLGVGAGGRCGPAPQPGVEGEAAGEGLLDVGAHPVPVDAQPPAWTTRHPEVLQRHAGVARECAAADSTSRPLSASTAGHPAEQPGPVGGHDGERVAAGHHVGAPRRAARPAARASGSRCAPPRAWSRPPARAAARCTSSSTSSAFQALHAAGPVASESASVRAASSSSGGGDAHLGRPPSRWCRVVEVAAGGHVGEQQVVADHVLMSTADVVGGEAHARAQLEHHAPCPTSVWSPG